MLSVRWFYDAARAAADRRWTIVLTGASGGIGRELAVQLAGRAACLVLAARTVERLEGLRHELDARHPQLRVVVVSADLSDQAEVERALATIGAEVGHVDVLVNNAGVGDSALFDQADRGPTRQVLATNVVAVSRLTAGLVPGMVTRGRGGVLNVGSGAGSTVAPASVAYTASKHFVDGFSEALRADLAGTGVVVTQVCPGRVDSGFDQAAGSVGGMAGGPAPVPAHQRRPVRPGGAGRVRPWVVAGVPGIALPDVDAPAAARAPPSATPASGPATHRRRSRFAPGPRCGGADRDGARGEGQPGDPQRRRGGHHGGHRLG